MFSLVIQFDVEPDSRDMLIDALTKDGEGTLRDETGALRFEFFYDAVSPNRILLYEVYLDEQAFKEHTEGIHFKQAIRILGEMIKNQKLQMREVGKGISIFPHEIKKSK